MNDVPCPICGKTNCEAMDNWNPPKYPPEVEAVLAAAETWEIAYTSEDRVLIEKIFEARNNLIATVRAYKEWKAKE
jgi:hypothetical protein